MSNLLPKHHFMFSVENPKYNQEHSSTTEEVAKFLNNNGEDAQIIQGHYGTPERSILVCNPMNIEGLHQLAKGFGQESILHSQNGKNSLNYINGPQAGQSVTGHGTKFFKDPPEDYYSSIHTADGPLYFQHNLNFETTEPEVPVKKSEVKSLDDLSKLLEVKDDTEEVDIPPHIVHMWSVPHYRWNS